MLTKILGLALLALARTVAIDAAKQKNTEDTRTNPDENVVLIIPVLHMVLPDTLICVRLVVYNIATLKSDCA